MTSSIVSNFIETNIKSKKLKSLLLELNSSQTTFVENIIVKLKPSENSLSDIINGFNEATKSSGESFEDVVQKLDFILADENIPRKKKLALLKKELELIASPITYKLIKELDGLASICKKKYGLNVEYPVDLEGSEISISFKVPTKNKMQEKAKKFQEFTEGDELDSIYNILTGQF